MIINMLKNLFWIILAAIALIGMYYVVQFFNFDSKNYVVDSTWKDEVGTLISATQGKIGASKFKYTYNGTTYSEYSQINVSSMVLGSKYLLKVNPKYPDKYVPLEWKPLFLENEKTMLSKGYIKNIRPNYSIGDAYRATKVLIYSYQINGEYLEATQSLPPNYKQIFPNINKGQLYLVEYWDRNPKRAIIYLDKPQSNGK